MEKETLEGVAKEVFKGEYICNGIDIVPAWREGFVTGAKWQQEQMYDDEDMMFAYEQGARLALLSQSPLALHKGEFPNPEEWFNDFKKENKLWK